MIKVTVDTDGFIEKAFVCRLSYVLTFIQNHPCAPDGLQLTINDFSDADFIINYSANEGDYQILPQKVYFKDTINSNLKMEEYEFSYKENVLKGFAQHGGSEFIGFDIFETIFFHISRYEEWYAEDSKMDQHGTLASNHQYLVKSNLHKIPLVDLLVQYFFDKIKLQTKTIPTSYTLSHDIDVLEKYPSFYKFLRGYGNILFYQNHKIKNLISHTKSYFNFIRGKQTDPYDTFEWLLIKKTPKITQKSIYLLTGGSTQYEGFFSILNPKVAQLIKKSKERGYKIGLHPSYNTISDKAMMKEELNTLIKVASENIDDARQHFLRFDLKKTAEVLDDLGIKTDSSLGYRDRIGFRCGTGFPYQLYNFDSECAFRFSEIPLIIMDIAAMRDSRWNSIEWCSLISEFIEKNKFNTHITFNFHNSFFDPALLDAKLIKKWYIDTFNQLK